MYNDVYDQMVEAGVTETLLEPIRANSQDMRFIRMMALKKNINMLVFPSYFVLVDEVGSNTSIEGDEYVSGEFFTVGKEKTANQSASKEDSHFTVLCITAATEGT